MVTGGGDGLLVGSDTRTAVDEADVAPGFLFLEAVEGVAGDDARLATAARVEVDLERVLLARDRGPSAE